MTWITPNAPDCGTITARSAAPKPGAAGTRGTQSLTMMREGEQ